MTAIPTSEGQTPAPQPEGPHSKASNQHLPNVLDAAASLLSMVVGALFILTFIAQPFRIPSASMEPTLLVGDFLLVDKMIDEPAGPGTTPATFRYASLPYREIERGDIIVFRYPPNLRIHVVKRVIGIPGDRVRLRDGVVYLNGQPQQDPYRMPASGPLDPYRDQFPAALYTDPAVDPRWWMQLRQQVRNGEYTVPANNYFVLGDNRSNSRDSRYWGLVPRQNIVGSPFLIYFSLRQSSTGDVSTLPDGLSPDPLANDRLEHRSGTRNPLTAFARWDRTFRVVR